MEIVKLIGIQAAGTIFALLIIFFLLKMVGMKKAGAGGCGCGCGGGAGKQSANEQTGTFPYELSV